MRFSLQRETLLKPLAQVIALLALAGTAKALAYAVAEDMES